MFCGGSEATIASRYTVNFWCHPTIFLSIFSIILFSLLLSTELISANHAKPTRPFRPKGPRGKIFLNLSLPPFTTLSPGFHPRSSLQKSTTTTMATDFQSFCESSPSSSTTATKYSSSTYNKLRQSNRNIVQRSIDRVRLEHYRYEVTYGVNGLTPWEKAIANAFVAVFLSLLIWTMLFYFPALLYRKLSRLIWLLTGHSGEEMVRNMDALSSMHGL